MYDRKEAYEISLALLHKCSTPYGFIASAEGKQNYNRIWGRDSMICSLAALMSDDKELINTVKSSLQTLIDFQHKHGMIPSNVDVKNKKVSYGGSAGRIDSILWFLIGFGQYVRKTNDKAFLKKNYSKFKKAFSLVHIYEFNEKGFLYIPIGGDWADEYIQEGYVLYDQLLYFRVLKENIYLRWKLGKKVLDYEKRLKLLEKRLNVNFWLDNRTRNSEYVYHKILYNKYLNKKKYHRPHPLPFFNPSGYGFRFDGFANSLALHFGIFSKDKENSIHNYISKNFAKKTKFLIPSFWPVITKKDYEWKDLKNNFSIKFRNCPHEYHNGGLWTMLTGFYASALALKNRKKALAYLDGINSANKLNNWNFNEFLSSKTFRAKGTPKQCWSAAASIMAYEAIINKKKVFL